MSQRLLHSLFGAVDALSTAVNQFSAEEVYECVGPEVDDLAPIFRGLGVMGPGLTERLQARLDQNAQFKPEMRFVLVDAEQRVYQAQRMCYRGSIDDFIDLHGEMGSIDELARRLVPTLGTDEFFELF